VTVRSLAAEFVGTALLLAAIVGSGITASIDGAASAQLFQHAAVVGAALVALILTFGHVSGAHFNPAVTIVDALFGGLSPREAAGYVLAQLGGAVTGVLATNLMFAEPVVAIATTERGGVLLAASEALATFGLLVVIFGVVRSGNVRAVPGAVGAYIAAAIYFTASAAFANPAVTVARALSDTYTGIAPHAVPGFLAGQAVGALAAAALIRWLFAPEPSDADHVLVPHEPTAARGHPRAAATTGETRMSDRPTVMFLCVHNAGRSQMAAGWLRHLAGDRVEVLSGGSDPAERIHPVATDAMAEVGIDITAGQPRRWTDETLGAADVVVTMGCGDTCPVVPGTRYLDWELDDPAGRPLEEVRPIRDDIERRVRGLMAELGVESSS
jgi:arsenate reductase